MAADLQVVPVIVGPTGVGKTALAVQLSRLIPIHVISADSRQVYRSLDIGTAKPTPDERAAVEHSGIDCVDPGRTYSAGRYRDDVGGWLARIQDGVQPVVVGGTGLYVRAVAGRFFDEPDLDEEPRDNLRAWLEAQGNLRSWAARLDPGYVTGGTQRTVRAIEVALLTGRPLSRWQQDRGNEPLLKPWYIRLSMDRAKLVARIESRVDAMFRAGLVDETVALLDQGFDERTTGLDAVGYRETISHIRGDLTLPEAREAIVVGTRQYAKRQETWFRNQLPGDTPVLDGTEPPGRNAERVAEMWSEYRNK